MHSHKAGAKKQQNKKHSSTHSSKRALKRDAKGRVDSYYDNSQKKKGKHIPLKATVIDTKAERKQRSIQIRKQKREQILQLKRFGKKDSPSKIVGFLSFSEVKEVDYCQNVLQLIVNNENVEHLPSVQGYNLQNYKFKDFQNCRTSLFTVKNRKDPRAVLDAAKMVDVLVIVLEAEEGMDDWSTVLVRLLKSQGAPSVILALTGMDRVLQKNHAIYKKEYVEHFSEEFSQEVKVVSCSTEADGKMLRRWIVEQTPNTIHWKEARPHLIATSFDFVSKIGNEGTLMLEGHVRGKKITPNALIHLLNFGTYQISKIEIPEVEDITPRPEIQEKLIKYKKPDIMGQEQPWITVSDLEAEQKKEVKVPKGFSSYQAAWVVDDSDIDDLSDREDDSDNQESENEMEDDEQEDEQGDELEGKNHSTNWNEPFESDPVADRFFDLEDDDIMEDDQREAERQLYLQQLKIQNEENNNDLEFVETPTDVHARVRFQKYRGLKSMRTSPWDPKENLPIDYSRIFQFKDFNRSKKVALNQLSYEEFEFAPIDTFVRIYIDKVPLDIESRYRMDVDVPLMVFSLFKHEQKYSVIHTKISKLIGVETPIVSKEDLIFQIGFRWFKCNPILSEYNPRRPKKLKTEKVMRSGSKDHISNVSSPHIEHTASFFAPITFKPAPVLVFKENKFTGSLEFVANGSIMDPDPDLILLKRIVLTGDIHRCHKRQAVIRFMFHSPDDVRWFKPVELKTEQGRHGVIKEPMGTHGYMKCLFDETLRQNDTVMMTLYKRIFPKWNTQPLDQLRIQALEEEDNEADLKLSE